MVESALPVDEAIRKAGVLIEALGWIRRFRGQHVVIKLGGSALDDPVAVRRFLTDVLFFETVGMHPILIHGGGKEITAAMKKAGLEARFVSGRRYTDAATLDIASSVLAGSISERLVAEFRKLGGRARSFSYLNDNCLIGRKLELKDEDGSPIDLGFVGEVVDIRRELLDEAREEGVIPVLPCIAVDSTGQRLNVNGDTAAAALARLLKAVKLVFVSDVPGILRTVDDPESLISHLTVTEARALIADGVVGSGMVPKVEAALEAIEAGVGKLHIVDGQMPHSVLLEIYSDKGVGTEIVA